MTQIKSRHAIFRFSQNRVVDLLSGLLSIHDPRMRPHPPVTVDDMLERINSKAREITDRAVQDA